MSDNELGLFLRQCREAVTPGEVGLPSGPRRRAPGLRRSELATLAGISVDYLTRLEQGRDRHPSIQVIGALADALRLSVERRIQLRRLAKAAGAVACVGGVAPPAESVRPTVRALLTALEPAPALVVNRLTDVLAVTGGYERLAGPVGLLDAEQPNLLRFAFTDPRARAVYPDWDHLADQHVANLKNTSFGLDPYLDDLVETLTVVGGAPFADRYAEPAGIPRGTGVERLLHPEVGELRLAYETLTLPEVDDQMLIAYLAADGATAAALDRLAGRRPGALRAATG